MARRDDICYLSKRSMKCQDVITLTPGLTKSSTRLSRVSSAMGISEAYHRWETVRTTLLLILCIISSQDI